MSAVFTKGFRFNPTDEELVTEYLTRKIRSPDFICFIKTMDLYDHDPWLLPHERDPCFGEHQWYYFVQKSPNGHKRLMKEKSSLANGWWKRYTEEIVKDGDEERRVIGWKSTLVFYVCNRSNNYVGITDWTMEEFKLPDSDEWFLCRLFYTDWNEYYDRPRLSGKEHPSLKWDALKQIQDDLSSSQNVQPHLFTYGFRFNPTDKELLTLYLAPKTRCSGFICFIKDTKVYSKEPWLLDHERNPYYKDKEWYYFVKNSSSNREQLNQKFSLCDKTKRWRSNGEVSKIRDNDIGNTIIGSKTKFSFNLNQSVFSRTGWKVEEFDLAPPSKWSVCKLTYKDGSSSVDDRPRLPREEHPKLAWQDLKDLHEEN
ncbi:unnamed protein product [Arabis nemorensis]|uniref:NAC domain-containing protein n=1 Tax=Arabis nemorensis TaxID=586526 RepID=A0A565ARW9_9BRAS|nr:unnamed protein product [Arabis nemorensis]